MSPEAPGGSAASVALRSLTSHVLGLANEAHGLLASAGRDDLAARLDEEGERWRGAATVVVVAGEVKRGKSSLINALVGRPGLLPVGMTVPTSAPLALSWAEDTAITVERWPEDGDEAERIDVEAGDLDRYASGPGGLGVRRIDVRLPSPLLADSVVVLDTPGIGSMTPGHRDLTLSLLGRADALVFVTSAEEPLLRSEADFLAQAAARVAEIEVAVTKCDLIADPDRLRGGLARRIGELAELVAARDATGAARLREVAGRRPVLTSALLHERAEAAGDATRARSLAERSGVGDLGRAIRGRAEDRTRLRLANVAQTASVVASLALADLGADPTRPPAMRLDPGRWRQQLGSRLTRIGAAGQRQLTGALNDLEARYRERTERSSDPAALVRDLPAELEAALAAAWLDVLAGVDDGLRAAIEELGADLAAEAGLDEAYRALPDRIRQASGGRRLEPARARIDPFEHGLPALSAAFLLSHLVLFPVGVVIGPAAIGVKALRQAKAKNRRQALGAVTDAVREARSELAGELQAALAERRATLESALEASLGPSQATHRRATAATDAGAALARIVSDAEAVRKQLVGAAA